jgi:hypothetical protein
MKPLEDIQSLIDENKEKISSDDYNKICIKMKELYKEKENDTEYVKIKYIDFLSSYRIFNGECQTCEECTSVTFQPVQKTTFVKMCTNIYNNIKDDKWISCYIMDHNCDCDKSLCPNNIDIQFLRHPLLSIERI